MSKLTEFYEDTAGAALEIQRELREAEARLGEYQQYFGLDAYAVHEIRQPINRARAVAEWIEQAGASMRAEPKIREQHPYPKR